MSNGSRSRAPGPARASRHTQPRRRCDHAAVPEIRIVAVPYELGRYSIQPSSRMVQPAFQIFVMWLIFPSSNSIA